MIEFDDRPTVYFDVDDTLILWDYTKQDGPKTQPHIEHINRLKAHKERGHIVVVWSAGGARWANQVVIELGLQEHVDLCITKPNWYYDDLKCEVFMPEHNRVYYKNT